MLTSAEAAGYESDVVMLGSVMIILIELGTGHMFFWMLWVFSFILVILGYIDHVCIGWRLSVAVQIKRLSMDIGLAVGFAFGLYGLVWILLPDIEMRSVTSILSGIQRLYRQHTYLGTMLYTFCYFLTYSVVIAFFRIFYNVGALLYCSIRANMETPAHTHHNQNQPANQAHQDHDHHN